MKRYLDRVLFPDYAINRRSIMANYSEKVGRKTTGPILKNGTAGLPK
jgi:hypothetical protein